MVHVRRAQARDADIIARLSAAAAEEAGELSGLLDAEHVRAHAFGQAALFEAWLAEPERRARPVGLALITKGYDVRRAVATVVLAELYIDPAHRRGGAARILLSNVAKRAIELGARELSITTGVGNDIARKFFAAVGAQERQALAYMMRADVMEWLAAEAR
ncbi:MAG: GNAT family N-acetyltransferase [Alphaproteobacteria bacterium]|nr:GNAT family N-acetyltransferase [Alphaproteobacteria bacterium]